MDIKKLEMIENKIREQYQDTKEDHSVCGKYSRLLQITREVLDSEGEKLVPKRIRLAGNELTHSVLWNEEADIEVLFLVTEGETFLGCASWQIPEEDREKKEIFIWEKHGDTESKWLKQEYLQELFF